MRCPSWASGKLYHAKLKNQSQEKGGVDLRAGEVGKRARERTSDNSWLEGKGEQAGIVLDFGSYVLCSRSAM